MATALIGSLFASRHSVDRIQVADPGLDARQGLQKRWPVHCFERATDAIKGMDAIVLAVKPQVLPLVLDEIGDLVSDEQLVISIVAGIHTSQIAAKLKSAAPIVRTMPNTPALIGLGITGMYAPISCNLKQRQLTQNLMESAGEVVWLERESLLDVVTAVSGSGPAYFYYLVESLRDAGTRQGLPADVAARLALYTAYGASTMAVQSKADVTELRQRVLVISPSWSTLPLLRRPGADRNFPKKECRHESWRRFYLPDRDHNRPLCCRNSSQTASAMGQGGFL
jgi:pyrroline-5-carboxylate reductase